MAAADVWLGRPADEDAWTDYRRALLAEGKTKATVYSYKNALEKLSAWLPDGVDLYSMTGAHVSAWLADGVAGGWAKSSLASYSRRVRTWCTWAERTGYADRNPMSAIRPVKEDIPEIPVPAAEDCAAVADMLSQDKTYEGMRDYAIVCMLAEAGTPRASEVGALPFDALDLRADELQFWGKGGLERTISLGATTCRAFRLYLRARAQRKDADLPWLFLGKRGKMTRHGILQMLNRRCDQAGVPRIPPHHWRHLTATTFLEDGGQVPDAMKLFGWRSPMMATRYGGAAASRRAVKKARELSIGDRILAATPAAKAAPAKAPAPRRGRRHLRAVKAA